MSPPFKSNMFNMSKIAEEQSKPYERVRLEGRILNLKKIYSRCFYIVTSCVYIIIYCLNSDKN